MISTSTHIDTDILVSNAPLGYYRQRDRIQIHEDSVLRVGNEEITATELVRFIKVMRNLIKEQYPEELL